MYVEETLNYNFYILQTIFAPSSKQCSWQDPCLSEPRYVTFRGSHSQWCWS